MDQIAVVFPGQGSQKPGMAQDFVEQYPESAAVFDRATKALGLDARQLCFTENSQLNLTEFTQPAILTAEIAMFECLKKQHGLSPAFYGGHSLGEYTALVAAGVIQFEDAVQIVRRRGALMQKAVPEGVGAMAALICEGIREHECLALVKSCGAEVANFNSTDQVVISGKKEGVEAACAAIKEKFPAVRAVPLNVSAPFHSSLMAAIESEFASFLKSFEPKFKPEFATKVVSNFTGKFHTKEAYINGLVKQISGSVLWLQNMETIRDTKASVLEIGPNRVLSKFFGTIGVTGKSIFNVSTMQKYVSGGVK